MEGELIALEQKSVQIISSPELYIFHKLGSNHLTFFASTSKTAKQQRARIQSVLIFDWSKDLAFYVLNLRQIIANSPEIPKKLLAKVRNPWSARQQLRSGCKLICVRIRSWYRQQLYPIGCFMKEDFFPSQAGPEIWNFSTFLRFQQQKTWTAVFSGTNEYFIESIEWRPGMKVVLICMTS